MSFQNRIEGEQTFSVIRAGTASQIQVGEIVVGDVIQVSYIERSDEWVNSHQSPLINTCLVFS